MEQITAAKPQIPVFFLLRENTLALDLIGPAEVFRYANRLAEQAGRPAGFALRYISAAARIDTSIGLDLIGYDALPEFLPANAILILIGCMGADSDFSSPCAAATVAWLRRHAGGQQRLLCICTGALLAGEAGLLDGRRCTTHHDHYDDLRRIAPRAQVIENRIYVDDGPVSTSAGVTTGLDLALHVVAQTEGYPFSSEIARMMVIYMRRAGTDPQISPWLAFRNHMHPAVHRVQDAILGDPALDWTVSDLAAVACVSERHLTRLFREHTGTGIIDYLHRIRIALARDLLTQSQLDIERIAEQTGFSSGRQLRRVWKKFDPAPPSQVRAG